MDYPCLRLYGRKHECVKVNCFTRHSFTCTSCLFLFTLIGALLMYDISCGLDKVSDVGLSIWHLALTGADCLQLSVC